MAEENTTDNIPAWVDPDFSYDPANPRKPNMREMMEAIAGKTVEEIYASGEDYTNITRMASDLIYGVVGSNADTRDFVAIGNAATDPVTGELDKEKFIAATRIATAQMYGGTTVSYQSGGYETDIDGNTIIGADNKPVELPKQLYIVGNNGTILRSLGGVNVEQMADTLKTFGVQDASWVDSVSAAMGDAINPNTQQAFDALKETYNPFANYQDLLTATGLITGQAPAINNFQIVSGKTISGTSTGTETTQVTNNQ